jgi:hypothetical protein
MQNLKFLLPFTFLALLVTACQKDVFNAHNSPIVNAEFAGQVLDENNQPIGGAQVRVGGDLVITDENGVFRFASMRLPSEDAKLMVSKIGYFDYSRAFYVHADAMQMVKIQLLTKEQVGTISGSAGGTIQLPGGAQLVFPAGAFADDRGHAYNGMVRVFGKSVRHNSSLQMPGDHRATNSQGEEMSLGHFGMLGVELFGQSGQELRIRQGAEATL